MTSKLAENFTRISNEVKKHNAHLVAVTKNQTINEIRALYDLGHRDFGENKVKDLLDKDQKLKDLNDLRWHFIGHLQSNKVKKLLSIERLFAIHSVDSFKILEKLSGAAPRSLEVFLQLKTSGEEEKFGLDFDQEFDQCLSWFREKKNGHLQLRGLMTMGKIRTDYFELDARRCFKFLKSQAESMDFDLELSMGMSQDYAIALDEGAKWVRVGSSLFS